VALQDAGTIVTGAPEVVTSEVTDDGGARTVRWATPSPTVTAASTTTTAAMMKRT